MPPSDAADRLPPSGSRIVTPATPADAGNRLPSSLPSSSREKSQSVSRTSTIEMNMLNSLPYEIPSSILDTIATNDSRTHEKKKMAAGSVTRVFFDFTRSSVSFLRAGLPSRVRAKLIEKTKNHMLGYSLV